jgi:predicted NAD/FAD-dependent oxidoreductase
VIATTADVARRIYKTPSPSQARFLDAVEYAPTINVSFKVPVNILNGIACVAISGRENPTISEYTNEALKGIYSKGKSLVNVGLHEGATREIIGKSDEEIFDLVRKEMVKVCPAFHGNPYYMENHDLERWPSAMPKFSQRFVSETAHFWNYAQGENSVHFAGDMTGCPWVEGAIYSGKKVAKLILEGI